MYENTSSLPLQQDWWKNKRAFAELKRYKNIVSLAACATTLLTASDNMFGAEKKTKGVIWRLSGEPRQNSTYNSHAHQTKPYHCSTEWPESSLCATWIANNIYKLCTCPLLTLIGVRTYMYRQKENLCLAHRFHFRNWCCCHRINWLWYTTLLGHCIATCYAMSRYLVTHMVDRSDTVT